MDWRGVFSEIATEISTTGLEQLREALLSDDDRLIQGLTTTPAALVPAVSHNCIEGCCPVAFTGLVHGLKTVEELNGYWGNIMQNVNNRLFPRTKDKAMSMVFTRWWDYSERGYVRTELAAEIALILHKRAA